jgi:hypothetical protein
VQSLHVLPEPLPRPTHLSEIRHRSSPSAEKATLRIHHPSPLALETHPSQVTYISSAASRRTEPHTRTQLGPSGAEFVSPLLVHRDVVKPNHQLSSSHSGLPHDTIGSGLLSGPLKDVRTLQQPDHPPPVSDSAPSRQHRPEHCWIRKEDGDKSLYLPEISLRKRQLTPDTLTQRKHQLSPPPANMLGNGGSCRPWEAVEDFTPYKLPRFSKAAETRTPLCNEDKRGGPVTHFSKNVPSQTSLQSESRARKLAPSQAVVSASRAAGTCCSDRRVMSDPSDEADAVKRESRLRDLWLPEDFQPSPIPCSRDGEHAERLGRCGTSTISNRPSKKSHRPDLSSDLYDHWDKAERMGHFGTPTNHFSNKPHPPDPSSHLFAHHWEEGGERVGLYGTPVRHLSNAPSANISARPWVMDGRGSDGSSQCGTPTINLSSLTATFHRPAESKWDSFMDVSPGRQPQHDSQSFQPVSFQPSMSAHHLQPQPIKQPLPFKTRREEFCTPSPRNTWQTRPQSGNTPYQTRPQSGNTPLQTRSHAELSKPSSLGLCSASRVLDRPSSSPLHAQQAWHHSDSEVMDRRYTRTPSVSRADRGGQRPPYHQQHEAVIEPCQGRQDGRQAANDATVPKDSRSGSCVQPRNPHASASLESQSSEGRSNTYKLWYRIDFGSP